MRNCLSWFSMLFLCLVSCTDSRARPTEKEFAALRGPVQSVEESTDSFTGSRPSRQEVARRKTTFDRRGNWLVQEFFHEDGLLLHLEYTYNDQGQMVKQIARDPDGRETHRYEIQCNDQGTPLTGEAYDESGQLVRKRVYHPDSSGTRITRWEEYRVPENFKTGEFVFDEEGRIVEAVHRYDVNEEHVTRYAYREAPYPSSTTEISPQGIKVITEFDSDGRPESKKTYLEDGSLEHEGRFEYQRTDSWNNWTRCRVTEEGDPDEFGIITRRINYFDQPPLEDIVTITAPQEVVDLVSSWDEDIWFFTSEGNPVRDLSELSADDVAFWGGEHFDRAQEFFKAAGVAPEFTLIVGGALDFDARKDPPRLFITWSSAAPNLEGAVRARLAPVQ